VVVEESDVPSELPGVRYVHLPRQGRGFGYARNVGVGEAQGDIILFIDDDCVAEGGWAEALIEPFHMDPYVLGVAGAVLVTDCGLIGYAENILGFPGGGLRYLDKAHGQVVPTRYLSTCNCAYRRNAVLEVGGFVEGARWGAEDSLLAERISALGPCVYTPQAVVYHRPRNSLRANFAWFVRRGQSEIGFMRATPAFWKSVGYLLRGSLIVRGLALVLLLAMWPGLVRLLPLVVLMYAGVILWRFRFAAAYPAHRQALWLVPVVKLTMDLGTEVGRWKAMLTRSSLQ